MSNVGNTSKSTQAAVSSEKTVVIPVRILVQLCWATQLQARQARTVDPKPTKADIDNANEWVLTAVESIKNCALNQGTLL